MASTQLPLTIFEEYMMADDRPSYPMESFVRLCFDGKIDGDCLDDAIACACERHTLFNSKVVKSGWYRYSWVQLSEPPKAIRLDASDSSRFNEFQFPIMKKLDIHNSRGFCPYLVNRDNKSELVFQIHHTVVDGSGFLLFFRDLAILLANCDGQSVPLPELDPDSLIRRGKYRRTFWEFIQTLEYTRTAFRFLFAPVIPVVPFSPAPEEKLPDIYPAIRFDEYTHEETQYYLKKAKAQGAKLNNMVLRDACVVIDQWRKKHNVPESRGYYRIAVPMNLRDASHAKMPAANAVTMVFVDVPRQECQDPEAVLKDIKSQNERIRRLGQQHTLTDMLKRGKIMTGDLGWYLKAQKCRSTFCLSNLKDLFGDSPLPHDEQGNLMIGRRTLTRIDTVPPIRTGTILSIMFMTYAGRIQMAIRYDPRFLTANDADELLVMLHQTLCS